MANCKLKLRDGSSVSAIRGLVSLTLVNGLEVGVIGPTESAVTEGMKRLGLSSPDVTKYQRVVFVFEDSVELVRTREKEFSNIKKIQSLEDDLPF